jgi:cytochrome c peroxidase
MPRRCLIVVAALLAALPGFAREKPSRERLVELGRRLFMEPYVSRSGRFSCASCHAPEHGFSDARVRSEEHDGPSRRHSQPVTDLLDGSGMHRDGEFGTLRELLDARLQPKSTASFSIHRVHERHFREAVREGKRPDAEAFEKAQKALGPPEIRGNVGKRRPPSPFAPIADRIRDDGRYGSLFEEVLGTDRPTIEQIVDALEAYVLSLRTGENALDRFMAGDLDALTAQQRRGYMLFAGEAGCASCHSIEPVKGRVPLTDHAYHDTGTALPALIVERGRWRDGDGGRGEMTHATEDLGRFKTPSLRDVARRAPYMHDGSFATLLEVVAFYDRGGRRHDGIDPAIRPLDLTADERAALVAFLEALTSPERAGVGPARPAQQTRLRIVDIDGRPLAGLLVRVVPFGDRLGTGRASADAMEMVTDRRGCVSFEFPSWTHVTVEAAGMEVGCGLPAPDSARDLELRAVPSDRTFVEVVQAPSVPRRIEVSRAGTCGVDAVLVRVRRLGGQRALYEVKETRLEGRVQVRLSVDQRVDGVVEMDFSGGESEPLLVPGLRLEDQGY